MFLCFCADLPHTVNNIQHNNNKRVVFICTDYTRDESRHVLTGVSRKLRFFYFSRVKIGSFNHLDLSISVPTRADLPLLSRTLLSLSRDASPLLF